MYNILIIVFKASYSILVVWLYCIHYGYFFAVARTVSSHIILTTSLMILIMLLVIKSLFSFNWTCWVLDWKKLVEPAADNKLYDTSYPSVITTFTPGTHRRQTSRKAPWYGSSRASSSLAVHTRSAFLSAGQQAVLLLCSFVITRRADL